MKKIKQYGASLIEMMMALLLMSIVLLGMDGVMIDSLRAHQSAWELTKTVNQRANHTERLHADDGFTLIEYLFAVFIGSIVMICVCTTYISIQQNHVLQTTLAMFNENAIIVSNTLRNAIHTAGYMGCAKLSDDFPIHNQTSHDFSMSTRLSYDSDRDAKSDTQAFTAKYMRVQHTQINKKMQSDSILYTDGQFKFLEGDILMISDCQTVDIFTVRDAYFVNNDVQKIMTVMPLSKRYDRNANLGFFEENTYFVSDTGRKNVNGSSIYALYMKDIAHQKTELVEGVSAIHVNAINDHDQKLLGLAVTILLDSINSYKIQKEWQLDAITYN